jgi:NagD protein
MIDLKNIKLFIMDVDGTISLDKTLFEGSADTINSMRQSGRRICLFTNNSSLGATDYILKLKKMGLSIDKTELFTSNLAAVQYLVKQQKGRSAYILGTKSARADFVAAGILQTEKNPDVVVLTLDQKMTYQRLSKACIFIEKGAFFVSTHDDLTCISRRGFLPDAGAFLGLIKLTTGRDPDVICGKPYAYSASALLERYKLKPDEVAMIGDRLQTDIQFGVANGFKSILVLSGTTKKDELSKSPIKPDIILDKIADIKKYL